MIRIVVSSKDDAEELYITDDESDGFDDPVEDLIMPGFTVEIDEKIYVENGTTSPSIDIYFIRQPAIMMYMIDIVEAPSGASTTVFSAVDDAVTYQGLADVDDRYNC